MRVTDRDKDDKWDLFDRWLVLRVVCDVEVDLTLPFWVGVSGLLAWGIWFL